jgi:fermentation-respiration switch protein FrsA (DUF1100 family)
MTSPESPKQPARSWRSATVRGVRFLVLLYLAWGVTLFVLQPKLLYLPALAGRGADEAEIAGLEKRDGLVRHWIERDGARVEAWLLPSKQPAARGLVAITHGNAELIDHLLEDAGEWRRMGFDVLLAEYRGYGRSTGSPSQEGIVGDTLAAIDWALARTARRTLVLHGRSLGTGVAMQVAGRLGELATPHALELAVLEAPFTSVASFAPQYGLPQFIVRDPYRTDEVLPMLECPVLILHARGDEVVPIAHGQALASLAPSRVELVEFDGTHNSGISMTRAYWHAVEKAAREALPPAASD